MSSVLYPYKKAGTGMDHKTAQALNQINKHFYKTVAAHFDATRQYAWAGWERVMQLTDQSQNTGKLRVLDVGCGNGRFGQYLFKQARLESYVGIDANVSLLQRAEEAMSDSENAEFIQGDIFTQPLDQLVPQVGFDLVVAFGVFHHIPGYKNRRRLMEEMVEATKTDGVVAGSFWQFAGKERFKEKTVDWANFIEQKDVLIDIEELEEDDYLLDWNQGDAVRYCHFISEQEQESLVSGLPVETLAILEADGKSGNLNRYGVYQKL